MASAGGPGSPASPGGSASPGVSLLLREHWRTGYGTGVLRAYYVLCFVKGVTVGVVGTSSLFIARRSGLPQHTLVAARGAGLTVGPVLLSAAIGRLALSGNSQLGFSAALAVKMFAEVLVPRTDNALALYSAFFSIGLVMNYLDTSAGVLVELVHGENCALPLLIYCAVYGVGAMVAPFITVAVQGQAWNLLALLDFAMAAAISARRLGRGRPRGWKERVSQRHEAASRSGGGAEAKPQLPARVLRAGLAFVVAQQAAETAMTSWAFTFASTELGLPVRTAALFPSTFYFAFTATRFAVVPATAWVPPSAILQSGTVLILLGNAIFFLGSRAFVAATAVVSGAALEEPPDAAGPSVWPLLAGLALFGAGTCPQYAMMLASMRRHGEMTAREHGLYNACKAFGLTAGMFFPGLFNLPACTLLWACFMFVVINISVRDFPWRQQAAGSTRDMEKAGHGARAVQAGSRGLLELTCDETGGLHFRGRRRSSTWSATSADPPCDSRSAAEFLQAMAKPPRPVSPRSATKG